MVFRIQATLFFANTAARNAGQTTIANAIAGRNTTVLSTGTYTKRGQLGLSWHATEADTGDAGTIYALIQAMASPLAGSVVRHHTCFHGDNRNTCLDTAIKVW